MTDPTGEEFIIKLKSEKERDEWIAKIKDSKKSFRLKEKFKNGLLPKFHVNF